MRRVVFAAAFLLVCPIAVAQHFHHSAQTAASPCIKSFTGTFVRPALEDRLQKVKWTVTGTEEARKFFSQGMTWYYGFNYEEALRNFRAAKEANGPSREMAMGSWGIALAAGPNINLGMDDKCRELAQQESARPYNWRRASAHWSAR